MFAGADANHEPGFSRMSSESSNDWKGVCIMTEMNRTVAPTPGTERRDVMDTIKDQARDLTSSAERMAGTANDKMKQTADAAREKVSEAASAAGDFAVQAKDKMYEWSATAADEAREVVQEGMHEVTSLVRRYPIQSLLVGVAVGFLVARATTRS
jgi:ElaB/YqjD/DUF883 family membrane-anchored ribosome-binding protein